jgi:hypothetical protein
MAAKKKKVEQMNLPETPEETAETAEDTAEPVEATEGVVEPVETEEQPETGNESPTEDYPYDAVVTKTPSRVRDGASHKAMQRTRYMAGRKVTIIGEKNGYGRMRHGLWINLENIRKIEPDTAPTEQEAPIEQTEADEQAEPEAPSETESTEPKTEEKEN